VFFPGFSWDFPGGCMTLVGTLFDQNDWGMTWGVVVGRTNLPPLASHGPDRPASWGPPRRTENIRDVGGFWQSCCMKTYNIYIKHELNPENPEMSIP
jgi:hypothetical protein